MAMASDLLAMASDLLAMASNQIAKSVLAQRRRRNTFFCIPCAPCAWRSLLQVVLGNIIGVSNELLSGTLLARSLLGWRPSLFETKKLLVTKGIATNVAPGLTTSNKVRY